MSTAPPSPRKNALFSYFLVAPEATPCHLLLPRIAGSVEPQRPQKLGEAFLDEGWGERVHAEGDDTTGAV